MAEAERFAFTHREIVDLLVKKAGVKEGIWSLVVEFGFGAANVGAGPDSLNPSAIVTVSKIGIQKVEEATNLAVDVKGIRTQQPKESGPRGGRKSGAKSAAHS